MDFAPKKRPRAAQCLSHPWLSFVPRILESSISTDQNQHEDKEASTKRSEKDEREAIEIGMGNIAIDGTSKSASSKQTLLEMAAYAISRYVLCSIIVVCSSDFHRSWKHIHEPHGFSVVLHAIQSNHHLLLW